MHTHTPNDDNDDEHSTQPTEILQAATYKKRDAHTQKMLLLLIEIEADGLNIFFCLLFYILYRFQLFGMERAPNKLN